ncbi:MAG: cytochrome c [Phycisphaerales bacterium]
MPRVLVYGGLLVVLLLLIPPAVVARVRAAPSPNQPVRIIQDMAFQSKFKPQSVNPAFADLRAMRPPVVGAVARGETYTDSHLYDGVVNGAWAAMTPAELPLTMELLERGRARFDIYCAVCHGYSGGGNGTVNQRAMELVSNVNGPVNDTQWVQAKNLVQDETVTVQPMGQIFHTITHGIRNMAGYASQVPVNDRWAIAAYVKALQRSQNARPDDVPADRRATLN